MKDTEKIYLHVHVVDADGEQNIQMVAIAANALHSIADHALTNSSNVFVNRYHRPVSRRNRRRQTVCY